MTQDHAKDLQIFVTFNISIIALEHHSELK